MLYDANIKLIQILCYLEDQILIDFVLFMTDFSTLFFLNLSMFFYPLCFYEFTFG